MIEKRQKWQPQAPSRWFVGAASLALSGLAMSVACLYGFQHWHVPWNSEMIVRLEWTRTAAGLLALGFGLWSMRYLPAILRLIVLAAALLALAMCLLVM